MAYYMYGYKNYFTVHVIDFRKTSFFYDLISCLLYRKYNLE